jgi:hypothetical protein
MRFDPDNRINKLCIQGMQLEGEAKSKEAANLFYQAWNEARDAQEKFTAAHYVARHQNSVADKLKWDNVALKFASEIGGPEIKAVYPSLYLNIAKGFEDLSDFTQASKNYQLALSYTQYLPANGYGNMILSGINKGLERLGKNKV